LKKINYQSLTIVGGSGFIGKSIIDSFNAGLLKKHKINTINIICRNQIIIKKKKLNLKKIKIFYSDISTLKELPKSDLYIYAAESSKVGFYTKDNNKKNIKLHKKSIKNFINLVSKFRDVKVLYISSGSVNFRKKIKSLDTYKKVYTELKIFSENQIKKLIKFKIKTSIARCYSFLGPHLPSDQHYAITNFLYDAKYKKKIVIKKKNTVIRSYMYSDDMVQWLITILKNSKTKTVFYNVGSDHPVELLNLAKKITKLFKNKVLIYRESYESKKIDKYVPIVDKTKNDLKLKILYNLPLSLKKCLKFI
jgi:nucleoside-diphosphate-sugar epimerase